MEDNPILSRLNLQQDTAIQLTGLTLRMWGRDLYFSCQAESSQFELVFTDCREMRWQLYTHIQDDENPAFPPSELVNLKIGRSQHRSPAHLLTGHFGLSLVYGELRLVYNEENLSLAD